MALTPHIKDKNRSKELKRKQSDPHSFNERPTKKKVQSQ